MKEKKELEASKKKKQSKTKQNKTKQKSLIKYLQIESRNILQEYISYQMGFTLGM
jgi:hypothetical protein